MKKQNRIFRSIPLLILFAIVLQDAPALAWGGRGHNIITTIAAEVVADMDPKLSAFTRKAGLLSHVSNLPDIQWRNGSDAIRRDNNPTHHWQFEAFADRMDKIRTADHTTLRELYAKQETRKALGLAPWRVIQLYQKLKETWATVKTGSSKKRRQEAAEQGWVYAGLIAHFVADLANPHHCTKNYDGQLTGQGGFHRYFETKLVEADALQLAVDAQQATRAPAESTFSIQDFAFGLCVEAHAHLDHLESLDREHALVKRSHGRRPAQRRDPEEVLPAFRPFLIARMSQATSNIARLWYQAWSDAGRPDFRKYFSYEYPLSVDFVPLPEPF